MVVISRRLETTCYCLFKFTQLTKLFSILLLLVAGLSHAAVLPEDRTDMLYHAYDGGGVEITGPSVLVRKGFKDTISFSASYYVDKVSSASIDVLTAGSTLYTEERTETGVGVDYLYNKTMLKLNLSTSTENDYEAETVSFNVSQDFFGDMSTLSFGYTQGDDVVMQNNNDTFREDKQTKRYRIGLTQVLTRKWIVNVVAESVIDQGFINNPYRSVRYIDSVANDGSITVGRQPEHYPSTRNSDAVAIRSMYRLPYRAAIRAEYRYFSDSWGIKADNFELRYIHPFKSNWSLEFRARAYSQNEADFFSDMFEYFDAETDDSRKEFRARDKEMSAFSDNTLGITVGYEFDDKYLPFVEKTTLKIYWDRIMFDYDNFRNWNLSIIGEAELGNEPFYSFDADVLRINLAISY